jgi:hypothetical protein
LLRECRLELTAVAQAYSEASVIVDLWLPGKRSCVMPQFGVRCTKFRDQRQHLFVCSDSHLGAETVSHEAILFDVIVVVAGFEPLLLPFDIGYYGNSYLFFADEMNGKHDRDFPIPQEFRVSRDGSTGGWNYTQLAGAIAKGIVEYDIVLPQVPFLLIFCCGP